MRDRRRSSWTFLAVAALLLAAGASGQTDAEERVLDYIREHLRPGQPLLVTELYSTVFTQPDERKVLDKLYNAFFRIPLFLAQYQEKFGSPPALKIVAEQFDLASPEAAEVLLRVMESDPRVPRFLMRDAETGEILRVDVEKIRSDPRFGQALSRQLGGWEGQRAPDFTLESFDGGLVSSAALRGKLVLLYIWFTGCPPCLKQTPELVALDREFSARGLAIVGANADRRLGLGYDDDVRKRYAERQKISFPLAHWSRETDAAFGHISIYPTLFLIDANGVIIGHWTGHVSPEGLRAVTAAALKEIPARQ